MYIILIFTVLIVAGGVFFTMYTLSYNAMVDDIRDRADGIRDHILENIYAGDLVDIGKNTEAGLTSSLHVQGILDRLKGTSNLSRLYVAIETNTGEIITTLRVLPGYDAGYTPTGKAEADLRLSLREGIAVSGNGIYQTDTGSVYTIFWPVKNQEQKIVGVVCIEFDVNIIYDSFRQAVIYSLALSGAMLVLISIIAYLSMSRVTESVYKKMAYTDILTGCENRMAFEHRLRECGDFARLGKNVTLIICDVNNLKTINDTIGHKAGDTYIINTSFLIKKNLGGQLPLYRIGGDEFASIIVDKDENEIKKIMEALHSEKRPAYKNHLFSCACGSATFTANTDETLRDTFKRADEAMYKAKREQKGLY